MGKIKRLFPQINNPLSEDVIYGWLSVFGWASDAFINNIDKHCIYKHCKAHTEHEDKILCAIVRKGFNNTEKLALLQKKFKEVYLYEYNPDETYFGDSFVPINLYRIRQNEHKTCGLINKNALQL